MIVLESSCKANCKLTVIVTTLGSVYLSSVIENRGEVLVCARDKETNIHRITIPGG